MDDRVRLGSAYDELAEAFARVLGRLVPGETGRVPDDLDERPVGDAVAVGQAPACEEPHVRRAHGELSHQACLADSGRAEQRDEPRLGERLRVGQRGAQCGDFPLPADERQVEPARGPRRAGGQLPQQEDVDLLALALQRHGRERLGVGLPADERPRGRAEQDPAARRGLLEALRRPHGVSRDREIGPGGEDLSGVHADAGGEPGRAELGVEADDGVAQLDGHAHGAERVVLSHGGHPEHRADCVPDELLDSAAVALDDRPRTNEVARQDALQRLRVEPLRELRRLDEVAEEDRDDLPGLALRRSGEGRATSRAEAGVLATRRAAAGAGRHRPSLRWKTQRVARGVKRGNRSGRARRGAARARPRSRARLR